MANVATIQIGASNAHSDRLLECIRERLKPYDVEIQAGNEGSLLIADVTEAVDDLQAFLATKLGECARDTGLDWDQYMTLTQL